MRKINIGAGQHSYKEDREALDDAPGKHRAPWEHQGRCRDTGFIVRGLDGLYGVLKALGIVRFFRT